MRRLFVSFIIQPLLLSTLVLVSSYAWAQKIVPGDSAATPGDTIKNIAKGDPKTKKDSLETIKLADLKAKSDLKTMISYKADDYMLLDMESKTLYLHRAGSLTYDKMVLNADSIAVDWNQNTMYADGLVDSMGQKNGRPDFAENEQSYRADRIAYNFKSQKGLVTMARTQQGSEYIIGEYVRKENDSTYYIKNGKFTSCELDHPHYYIKSSKLKVIPQKKIITGPLMLVIEDFPLPLVVPFGFFPNQTGQRSGLVMPTYGESAERGFFLRNGGYYFAINDHVDLLLRGDIFSKGGYRLEVGSAYNKRYKYQGNFQFEYGLQRFGERDDPEQFRSTETNFKLIWKHDQTINPQARFFANVNVLSSNFNRANSYIEQDYLSNTFKSTISYTQSFANSPWRLGLNLNHSQNTQTKQVALDMPIVTLNRTRFFPFKGKNSTGSKWYHNIGLNYSMGAQNQISVTDTLLPKIFKNPFGTITYEQATNGDTSLVTKNSLDFFNNGMSHTIPISTQLNLASYVNIQPSITYHEYWYYRTKNHYYDVARQTVASEYVYGLATARDFNAAVSASTRIYGLFGGGNKRGTTVRHTLQPSLGFTYRPDFADVRFGFYENVRVDTTGRKEPFSRFAGGIQGGPPSGEQQLVTLGINNILELKYRTKTADGDSALKDPFTRITLLDAFSASTSYNFAADSLQLAPLGFSARTNILNNKFNIQLNGAVDPYTVDPTGRRINVFRYEKNGSIGRLSTMTLAFSTVLSSKKTPVVQPTSKDATPEELNNLQLYRDLYVDFNIPWRLNFSANFGYTNTGIFRDTTFTINTSGDFNMTPKWKIGFTTGYDFSQMDFSYTSLTIYRDLHCWEMSMTWIPFGDRKSYNFTLNVKSSTLKDLKLTKRRDWQDRFE